MAAITDLTPLTAIASGDYLVVNDVSAGSDKKITQADFLGSTGTWTPVLAFGGASTGITYSTQVGSYTRVGRIVLAELTIMLTSKGSASGNATIAGLPFASAATVGSFRYWAGAMYWRSMAATGYHMMALIPSGGSTTINLYVTTDSTTTGGATNSNFSNTSEIIITLMYEAA